MRCACLSPGILTILQVCVSQLANDLNGLKMGFLIPSLRADAGFRRNLKRQARKESSAVTVFMMSDVRVTDQSRFVETVSESAVDWSFELGRHSRWLRSVLLARSRDPGAVEELFQEVSLAAVHNGDSLQDTSKTGPWLYRIAVRQALLHRRKLGRLRRNLPPVATEVDQVCESGQPDPLDWLLADERSRMIRQALGTLPSREAELLILKYTENWSYRELARHLDTTEGAVESRLHRARQKLRAELARRQIVEV